MSKIYAMIGFKNKIIHKQCIENIFFIFESYNHDNAGISGKNTIYETLNLDGF